MPIRIFDVDPDSAPKPTASEDLVGRFRSGYVKDDKPASLTDWRITSDDPDVIDAVAALLGGEPQSWDSERDPYEVFTSAPSVEVILEGPNAIRSEMVLWGRNNSKVRGCDGVTQTDEKASPCVCPATLSARKDAAKAGHGCEPSITFYFRLAAAPDLGKFRFTTGSWSMVTDLTQDRTEERLGEFDGPVLAALALEVVSFEARNGPRKGQTVSYTKPTLTLLGPAPVATEDDGEPY